MNNGLAVVARVVFTMALLVLAGVVSGCADYAAGPDPSPLDSLVDPGPSQQGWTTR